ncbi:MAG: hypothetical protein LBT05_04050 [Planctomycetaceae bacterium]|jgi:TIGR03009 family protein|nr:hypothetical protein [Planctomycetaceae bacterium]
MKSWTSISLASFFLFAVMILAECQNPIFAQVPAAPNAGTYPPQYPYPQERSGGAGYSNTPNSGGGIPAYRSPNLPNAAYPNPQQQANQGYATPYPQIGSNGTPNAVNVPNGNNNFPNGNFPNGQNVPTGNPADRANYMIEHPLGAPLNGNHSTINPSLGAAPNIPQIIPPPKDYTLTPQDQQNIERFLAAWQEKSKTITALDYDFLCYEYNSFSKKNEKTGQLIAVHTTYGNVKYRAPDKGIIETIGEYDANGNKIAETNLKSKFVCTGTSVYQFDHAAKKLTEFTIPKEQQGKGVLDSPLMVLVGANPIDLQGRFYLKILPRLENMKNCVRFQAWPKLPDDAKEFNSVVVVIDDATFDARGLQLFNIDGTSCKNYIITNTKKSIPGKIGEFLTSNKDDFERETILKSKPKDWIYTRENPIDAAASNSQLSRQPNPIVPYRAPDTTPAQPNPPYASPVPPQTQHLAQPNGFAPATTGIASVPGQYLQDAVPSAARNENNFPQTPLNNNPQAPLNSPQGYYQPPQPSEQIATPPNSAPSASRWR